LAKKEVIKKAFTEWYKANHQGRKVRTKRNLEKPDVKS